MSDTPAPAPEKQRLTSVVRRGFRQILDRNFEKQIEEIIRQGTKPELLRSQKFTVGDIKELRDMVKWIKQEAAPEATK